LTELFFDTETSGFHRKGLEPNDPNQAWVVQLGAILSDKDHIYAAVNITIRPQGRTINPGAQKIHGISVTQANNGVGEFATAAMFANMIMRSDTLVCHNFNFDIKMVRDLLIRNDMNQASETLNSTSSYCTMQNSTDLCKLPGRWPGKFKWPKLTELHKCLFNEDFSDAHNAMADVMATRRCYYELRKRGY